MRTAGGRTEPCRLRADPPVGGECTVKRNLRHTTAVALVAAIGLAFVALPAVAARDVRPADREARAPDGQVLVRDLVNLLGSWFQELVLPPGEALKTERARPNPGEGTDPETPGVQEQSGGSMDPDG